MLAKPSESYVAVRQMVGRASRPSAGKREGCVLLPLVSIPTFHKLRFVSLLSVGSMVYVTFVVVFRGAVRQRNVGTAETNMLSGQVTQVC